ncbi:hypothetical protein GCM10020255_076290 [Rhodococcus baikonurensis]
MSFDDGDNGENAREEYGAPRRRSRQRSEKPSQRAEGGTEAQAKDACLRLLTDRARSRSELETKLSGRGFEPEIITKVLDRLQEIGLIDDADFANQWVHSRHTYSGKESVRLQSSCGSKESTRTPLPKRCHRSIRKMNASEQRSWFGGS